MLEVPRVENPIPFMLTFILLVIAVVSAGSYITVAPLRPTTFTACSSLKAIALSKNARSTRADVLKSAKTLTAGILANAIFVNPHQAIADSSTVTLPSGVTYTISKDGDGPAPSIGELVAIRFKASFGDSVIDDIFDTPEPYYTRVGTGALLKV